MQDLKGKSWVKALPVSGWVPKFLDSGIPE